jgi:hypothetical protein
MADPVDDILRKYETPAPAPEPDSATGFLEGAGKFVSGVGRGLSGTLGAVAPYLPGPSAAAGIAGPVAKRLGVGDIPDPAAPLREYGEGGAREGPEAWGKFAGEMAPTFVVPELGFARGAMTGLGRLAGAASEAGMLGTAGAVMTPGATAHDVGVGATTSVAAKGVTSGIEHTLAAVPPRYRWYLNMAAAGAATAALHEMGVPSGWWSAPLWWGLYRSRLTDLAQRWAGRASRLPSAPIGSVGARVSESARQNQDSGDADGR